MTHFSPDHFIGGEFWTPQDKAKFANHMVRFLNKGCPETLFQKWFYTRLSNCFGHIAHYNQGGFYDVWFSDAEKRLAFLRNILNWPGYGDPKFTFSDVEKALAKYVRENKALVEKFEAEAGRTLVHPLDGLGVEFKVAAVSSNRNAFGHRQYVLVQKDGTVWKATRYRDLPVGHEFSLPLYEGHVSWGAGEFEIPERMRDKAPAEVLKKVWG